jgi:hypothetical protein
MQKNTIIKLIIAGVLLFITIVFAILDNEIIYPSALVGFLLVVTTLGDNTNKKTLHGKAAQHTVKTFAVLVLTFNVLASAFMPVIDQNINLAEYFEEETTDSGAETGRELEDHFVAVFLNDLHELCFVTSFILLINGAYLLVLNRKTGSLMAESNASSSAPAR